MRIGKRRLVAGSPWSAEVACAVNVSARRQMPEFLRRSQGLWDPESLGAEVARFTSAYDPASNVVSRARTVAGGPDNGTWTYGYDDSGRLTTPGTTAPAHSARYASRLRLPPTRASSGGDRWSGGIVARSHSVQPPPVRPRPVVTVRPRGDGQGQGRSRGADQGRFCPIGDGPVVMTFSSSLAL